MLHWLQGWQCCMCVFVCACIACVCTSVRACVLACVRACMHACALIYQLPPWREEEHLSLSQLIRLYRCAMVVNILVNNNTSTCLSRQKIWSSWLPVAKEKEKAQHFIDHLCIWHTMFCIHVLTCMQGQLCIKQIGKNVQQSLSSLMPVLLLYYVCQTCLYDKPACIVDMPVLLLYYVMVLCMPDLAKREICLSCPVCDWDHFVDADACHDRCGWLQCFVFPRKLPWMDEWGS